MNSSVRHIYIIDDDEDDYYLFSVALKEVDSSVKLTWFDNCGKMLRKLEDCRDLPDLIVLDLNVPGNQGHSCLLLIKQHPAGSPVPVIIFSTSSSTYSINTAKEYGAYEYMIKPNSIEDLKQLVRRMLVTPLHV